MFHFGDQAALALVAEGDADIGDEAAGKGQEGHGGKNEKEKPPVAGGARLEPRGRSGKNS
jgi:hypothetical protein